jgi:hypothetical protein
MLSNDLIALSNSGHEWQAIYMKTSANTTGVVHAHFTPGFTCAGRHRSVLRSNPDVPVSEHLG